MHGDINTVFEFCSGQIVWQIARGPINAPPPVSGQGLIIRHRGETEHRTEQILLTLEWYTYKWKTE